MKDRINKPRVFLSHSKLDIGFIQRLYDDLRRCQIEPWLDEYEIRHGQPWLDAIFEDGMPACDAVVAYLTAHSIASAVVRKEIDVGILQKLRNSHVAFLPYVAESAIRTDLRPDLQTLQAPEWNADNYTEILPRVVAEIWRSYLERTVLDAVQRERLARVEAELRFSELANKQAESVFSTSEAGDFEYVWKALDRYDRATFLHTKGSGTSRHEIATYEFLVHVGSILLRLSGASSYEYQQNAVFSLVRSAIDAGIPQTGKLPKDERVECVSCPNIGDELLMYGFVTRFHKGSPPSTGTSRVLLLADRPYALMYTEKLERFKYWLAVQGTAPRDVLWEPTTAVPTSPPSID